MMIISGLFLYTVIDDFVEEAKEQALDDGEELTSSEENIIRSVLKFTAIFMLLLGLLAMGLAWFTWNRKPWARTGSMIFTGILLFLSIIGISSGISASTVITVILLGSILYLLTRPEVKYTFDIARSQAQGYPSQGMAGGSGYGHDPNYPHEYPPSDTGPDPRSYDDYAPGYESYADKPPYDDRHGYYRQTIGARDPPGEYGHSGPYERREARPPVRDGYEDRDRSRQRYDGQIERRGSPPVREREPDGRSSHDDPYPTRYDPAREREGFKEMRDGIRNMRDGEVLERREIHGPGVQGRGENDLRGDGREPIVRESRPDQEPADRKGNPDTNRGYGDDDDDDKARSEK